WMHSCVECATVAAGPADLYHFPLRQARVPVRIGNLDDEIVVAGNRRPRTDVIAKINELENLRIEHVRQRAGIGIDLDSLRAKRRRGSGARGTDVDAGGVNRGAAVAVHGAHVSRNLPDYSG